MQQTSHKLLTPVASGHFTATAGSGTSCARRTCKASNGAAGSVRLLRPLRPLILQYEPPRQYTCRRSSTRLRQVICASNSSRRTAKGGTTRLLVESDDLSQRPWLWQATIRVLRSELLRRSLATIALLVMLRLTGFIPPPGIDVDLLPSRSAGSGVGPEMFAGMLELPVSIGSLGLGPYLSAGIIVSLAAKSAKSFKIMIFEFWAEDGQDGRASLMRLIQGTGTAIALYGAWTVASGLSRSPAASASYSAVAVAAVITAASAIHSAVVGAIEEHGIGDGSNVIIAASIMSGYASQLVRSWPVLMSASSWLLPTVAAAYAVLATAAVTLNQLELRLPLIHFHNRTARAPTSSGALFGSSGTIGSGPSDVGSIPQASRARSTVKTSWASSVGAASVLPLRVCPSGVFSLLIGNTGLAMLGPPILKALGCVSSSSQVVVSCVVLFVIVSVMETVMHRGSDTPTGLSKSLLHMEAGLQGTAPGVETQEFLSDLDQKLALIGGVLMGMLAVAAYSFDQWCVHVIGVALGTTNVLLVATLASSSITQVMTLWQETAVRELTERENVALNVLLDQ